MKKLLHLFILGWMSILFFAACHSGRSSEPVAPQQDSDEEYDSLALRIGYLPTLDALPLLIAQQEGILDSLQLDIKLVPYTSQMDLDTAIIAKRVHGILTDICKGILLNADNDEMKIVARTDGVSKLITQRKLRLRKIGDLPERMIAIARNDGSDWLLDLILKQGGVDVNAVNRPQINNIQLRQEMVSKEMIDAAIVPEPYATQAAIQGDRILSSSEDQNMELGCMVFPLKVLVNRENELNSLVKAYNQAVSQIEKSPKGTYDDLLQKAYGIDAAVTDTLELPHYTQLGLPDSHVIENATQWLKNRYTDADWLGFRLLKSDYTTDHLIDKRLIQGK